MSIASSLAVIGSTFDLRRSYWKAMLTSGKELSECGLIFDFRVGGLRPFDWTLDLGSTGDWKKIKTLSLYCPGGQEAILLIDEPGTAFQFKTSSLDAFGSASSTLECQVIGRVDNKEEGTCTCHIYDYKVGLIEYHSSVYDFGSWRDGIAPIKALSQAVLGLRL